MVKEHRGIITGMSQITEFTGLSEPTVLYLIENAAFPAKKTKVDSGVWISNTDSINEWSRLFSMSKI